MCVYIFDDLLDVTWAVKHYIAAELNEQEDREGRVGRLWRRRIVYSDPARTALRRRGPSTAPRIFQTGTPTV